MSPPQQPEQTVVVDKSQSTETSHLPLSTARPILSCTFLSIEQAQHHCSVNKKPTLLVFNNKWEHSILTVLLTPPINAPHAILE